MMDIAAEKERSSPTVTRCSSSIPCALAPGGDGLDPVPTAGKRGGRTCAARLDPGSPPIADDLLREGDEGLAARRCARMRGGKHTRQPARP